MAKFASERKHAELVKDLVKEQQGFNEPVSEFAARIENQWQICNEANKCNPPTVKINTFLNSLSKKIIYETKKMGPETWEDALKYAKIHEDLLMRDRRTVGMINDSDPTNDLIALVVPMKAENTELKEKQQD